MTPVISRAAPCLFLAALTLSALVCALPCRAQTHRWIPMGDGTVLDPDTELYWTENAVQGDTLSAPKVCEDLDLAGHDDWRLPSADELAYMLLDPFYDTTIACVQGYWSGDLRFPDAFHQDTAYVTCEDRGWEQGLAPFPRLVHCVRKEGGEDGQNAGQDGGQGGVRLQGLGGGLP